MRVTQGGVLLAGTIITAQTRLTQTGVLAAYGMPTNGARLTAAPVQAPVYHDTGLRLTSVSIQAANHHATPLRLTSSAVLAAVKGRVYNPKLRAWTYTLDGHDYYVLKLADDKTLVYDLSTQQWSWFSSPNVNYWRLVTGFNWVSCGGVAAEYGSNVVVGDDTFGIIWVLNPEQGYDDDPRYEGVYDAPVMPFQRRATAQMMVRSRNAIPVYEVYLAGSMGQPTLTGQQVTLNYSDDLGKNFINAGSHTLTEGDYNQEIAWRSLGQVRQPGRLFSIEDDGALARIDGLEVSDGS